MASGKTSLENNFLIDIFSTVFSILNFSNKTLILCTVSKPLKYYGTMLFLFMKQ